MSSPTPGSVAAVPHPGLALQAWRAGKSPAVQLGEGLGQLVERAAQDLQATGIAQVRGLVVR